MGLAPAIFAGQTTEKPGPVTVPVYRPMHLPFDGGEKAVYLASWNGMLSVATAAIYTTPQMIEGKKFCNVRVEASHRGCSIIWKMRDDHLDHRSQEFAPTSYLQSTGKCQSDRHRGAFRSIDRVDGAARRAHECQKL